MTVEEVLTKNITYVRYNPISILTNTKDNDTQHLFTGYISEFSKKLTREEFDEIMGKEVKETRYFFEEFVIELK